MPLEVCSYYKNRQKIWRGTQLTVTEAVGGLYTYKRAHAVAWAFTLHLVYIEISDVSVTRLQANASEFFQEEPQK